MELLSLALPYNKLNEKIAGIWKQDAKCLCKILGSSKLLWTYITNCIIDNRVEDVLLRNCLLEFQHCVCML